MVIEPSLYVDLVDCKGANSREEMGKNHTTDYISIKIPPLRDCTNRLKEGIEGQKNDKRVSTKG